MVIDKLWSTSRDKERIQWSHLQDYIILLNDGALIVLLVSRVGYPKPEAYVSLVLNKVIDRSLVNG